LPFDSLCERCVNVVYHDMQHCSPSLCTTSVPVANICTFFSAVPLFTCTLFHHLGCEYLYLFSPVFNTCRPTREGWYTLRDTAKIKNKEGGVSEFVTPGERSSHRLTHCNFPRSRHSFSFLTSVSSRNNVRVLDKSADFTASCFLSPTLKSLYSAGISASAAIGS